MTPPLQVPTKQVKSSFLESFGEVGEFAGRLVKHFSLYGLIGILFTLVLAVVVYLGSNNGQVWRGILGAVVALGGGGIASVIVAMKLSVVISLCETVRAKRLAQRILETLFATSLGVTAENPHGDLEVTRALHGLPITELESRLKQAGRAMLEDKIPATGLTRIARWLVNRALRVLVWATIKVVIAYASAGKRREDQVDLLALRTNLAEVVDNLVVVRLQENVRRFALLMALAIAGGGWLLATGLRRLPF